MDKWEEEKQALLDWMKKETDKIDREYQPSPGLDDGRAIMMRPVVQEFNRRLLAIKAKYGK